jgi:uncharacterized protein (TIGR03546 family)
MFSVFLWPLRQAVKVLTGHDSPRQVAAGFALGVVLGMVPKGNLLAIAVGVALCALQVNRTAGIAAAVIFSWLSGYFDGISHRLGERILEMAPLQQMYATIYEAPLGPLWGFNNTVVLGSLLVGIYLTLPCYLIVQAVVAKYQPIALAWISRYRLARVLLGADLTARFSME